MRSKILEAVYHGKREELTTLLASAPALTVHVEVVELLLARGAVATRQGHAQLAQRVRGEMP